MYQYERPIRPVVTCHSCGAESQGLHIAKREGWEGFSENIEVAQQDGSTRIEHLGQCRECQKVLSMANRLLFPA